jgi:hypothetical protein
VLLHVPNLQHAKTKWGRAEAPSLRHDNTMPLPLDASMATLASSMAKLPTIITTSVVRSARQGESHGGVYLVHLHSGNFEQVIDWNDPSISWEGRGGDRGLRGIAFHHDKVYIAASDEIFVYNRSFELLESFRNKYLKHCHEICMAGNTLYLTSTELNSILHFDLVKKRFTRGYTIAYRRGKSAFFHRTRTQMQAIVFDPNRDDAFASTLPRNDLHINNISAHERGITISGTRIDALLILNDGVLREYAPLPIGTHNASLYRDGIIYNDTRNDRVVIADIENRIERQFPVPKFPDLPKSTSDDYARQSFGRGLCTFGDNYIIAGSSPSTVSVYEMGSGERVQMVNLSKDIRNCIHGLELWSECSERRAFARPSPPTLRDKELK